MSLCLALYCFFTTSLYYRKFNKIFHVNNNVMTTRYIILSVGTSNVMTTSVTTMLCFIEINKL